ncbi:MAG TPA: TIGR00295 family protein [Nitrospirae bacterium]|nr:TIGR00295 family protein [Nitrospirota bacterium]
MITLEALKILREAGCPEEVVSHILAVTEVALRIADEVKIDVDRDLIKKGALLHDLGRAKTHGMDHAVVGAEMARERGFEEPVLSIIENHIGAGITRDEARKLGLPERDYIPETPEQKIVAYADNLINGDREVTFEEAIKGFKGNLGDDHPAVRRFMDLHNEIEGWKVQ